MTNTSIKTFHEKVRGLEIQDFPEFTDTDIYDPNEGNYFYFAPSWHINSRLITEELIEDIKNNNKQILSVGSGTGYLERFMEKRLGIKKEQITLSDEHPIMPKDFESFVFDMYKEWPDFRKKFDYVIFPESVLLNTRFIQHPERQEGLYNLIKNSLATMKSNSQIRINGHSQIEDNSKNVKRRLEMAHEDSKMTYDRSLIVVERSNS